MQKLEGHTSTLFSAVFSPDGNKIVTASSDKTARVWDWARLAEIQSRQIAGSSQFAAGAIDVKEELRQKGINPLCNYVKFGNTELRDKFVEAETNHRKALTEVERNNQKALREAENNLRRADAFEKADAQAALDAVEAGIESAIAELTRKHEAEVADITQQMKAATADIASKKFFGEYSFTTTDVQVDGNTSSFTMMIPAGFVASKIGEVIFPMPNVTGKVGSSERQVTSPIRMYSRGAGDYAILVRGDRLVLIDRDAKGTVGARDPRLALPKNDIIIAESGAGMVMYARYDHPSQIVLTVSGSTDSIREFVRNSDNFQVRVQFTNLQHKSHTEDVKYWRVSTSDGTTAVVDGQHPNPFTLDEKETVRTVTGDVLKIEVVRIR